MQPGSKDRILGCQLQGDSLIWLRELGGEANLIECKKGFSSQPCPDKKLHVS